VYPFRLIPHAYLRQDLGGGPNHDRLGFRYWKNPGPFVQYNGISGTEVHTPLFRKASSTDLKIGTFPGMVECHDAGRVLVHRE
jgi:hypothetical protein